MQSVIVNEFQARTLTGNYGVAMEDESWEYILCTWHLAANEKLNVKLNRPCLTLRTCKKKRHNRKRTLLFSKSFFLWGRRQFSAFAEFSILFFSLLWPRAFCRECLWKYSRRSHFHGSLCSSQFVVASTILSGMYIKGAVIFLGRFSYRPSWHLTIGSRYYRCLKWNLSPKRKKRQPLCFSWACLFCIFYNMHGMIYN